MKHAVAEVGGPGGMWWLWSGPPPNQALTGLVQDIQLMRLWFSWDDDDSRDCTESGVQGDDSYLSLTCSSCLWEGGQLVLTVPET